MRKIALITDSASDISTEDLNKHNIKLLPFKIIFSDKEYDDRLEITPEFLYDALPNEIPTTSLPSIERITNTLREAVAEGCTHAIIITLSSELSGTYNSIRLACENVNDITTFVYDSKTLSMAEGVLVLETAKLIEEGKSFNEIIDIIPTLTSKIDIFFTIDTLEYLKKGGRIGKVAGTIGEVLNLKPVITVGDDGIYHTYCKARGKKQALSKLVEILKSYLAKDKCRIWIMSGNGLEQAQSLFETIKNLENVEECHLGGTIGPALGVHTGPGLFGFIVEKVD
ncbi:DegV family protein [Clostridium uliginosum]|uniref:EDD domain protein, DegV family n=1 Tax=Clostridium uliginosum TaxID=119641 RepID=A0A1I1L3Z3_9CLOT|nr:DegV family protein [Clostridium uliginosum]SFC67675.1 EDD domain protein, DegV family [Clostridium uliginosum]